MTESNGRILIVDDEEDIRHILSRIVRQEGFEPFEASDGGLALAAVKKDTPDMILLDVRMPGLDGMTVLGQVKKLNPDVPVVMITSQGSVKDAVAALRAGAHDYLTKPFEHTDVIRSIHTAMTDRRLRRTIQALADQTIQAVQLREMMGASEAISRICADVGRVACSDFTVLILGETGTGKELVARAIHQCSTRAAAPFVAVDCGAIPETLFESELFGHEKGAFTGADRSKPGKFEIAKGGTLFLDEISNMPLGSQAKLLRALQERTAYHVGGTQPFKVDVRSVVAANEDLEALTARGTFRKDLFFRLNEFVVRVPPLRERKQDIVYLAKRFLDGANEELGKCVEGLSERSVQRLLAFPWPGNVRQLRSTIRRAVLLADTVIDEEQLGLPVSTGSAVAESVGSYLSKTVGPLKQLVRSVTAGVEKTALADALRQTGGNKARAARLLQIDYKTLHTKLKEHGMKTRSGGDNDQEEH